MGLRAERREGRIVPIVGVLGRDTADFTGKEGDLEL